MARASGGLAALLHPASPETFLAETYERAPLHGRGAADRFTALISTARLDALLAEQVFSASELSMARSEPKVQPDHYLNESGFADPGLVARQYQKGATLILPQLHRRERALADLCRGLEADLSHPVQTNIYLTPPNAQGFQTHYDNHDVFVLQVEGRKRWRLYDAPAGMVFRGERFTPGGVEAGDLREELTLEPGDVLYVPRGVMHDAVNEDADGPSLHVTTGVMAKTWADWLLEAVSEAAIKNPELRRALPPGFHKGAVSPDRFRQAFDAALDGVRDTADLEAVTALFADRFVETRTPDTAGALLAGPAAGGLSVRLRTGLPGHLAEDGHHIALVTPGGVLTFDTPAEAALECLISGAPVSAADFAALGEDKARDAIERLVAFGVVYPA